MRSCDSDGAGAPPFWLQHVGGRKGCRTIPERVWRPTRLRAGRLTPFRSRRVPKPLSHMRQRFGSPRRRIGRGTRATGSRERHPAGDGGAGRGCVLARMHWRAEKVPHQHQNQSGDRHAWGQDDTFRFGSAMLPNFVAYATKFGKPNRLEKKVTRTGTPLCRQRVGRNWRHESPRVCGDRAR